MNKSFKATFLVLALYLSFVACKSNKKANAADSTLIDTTNVDTLLKDSAEKDTSVKVTAKTTETMKK